MNELTRVTCSIKARPLLVLLAMARQETASCSGRPAAVEQPASLPSRSCARCALSPARSLPSPMLLEVLSDVQ